MDGLWWSITRELVRVVLRHGLRTLRLVLTHFHEVWDSESDHQPTVTLWIPHFESGGVDVLEHRCKIGVDGIPVMRGSQLQNCLGPVRTTLDEHRDDGTISHTLHGAPN